MFINRQIRVTLTKKVLSMRLSSFFLESQRSHRNMYTSSVSTSTTSTWSRYQSAPAWESSCRIRILNTWPRSTASMLNLSTYTNNCFQSPYVDLMSKSIIVNYVGTIHCVIITNKTPSTTAQYDHTIFNTFSVISEWCHVTEEGFRTHRSSLKLVTAALRFAELSFSRVSQISVDGQEDVGIGAGSVHVARPHRHLIRVSWKHHVTSSSSHDIHSWIFWSNGKLDEHVNSEPVLFLIYFLLLQRFTVINSKITVLILPSSLIMKQNSFL